MGAGHDRGRKGEQLAADRLLAGGWQILARNVRLGHREIDLVVRKDAIVAFVEVKTRSGPRFGHPLEAVTALKRREIERVARWWVARHGREGECYRFDAVAVTLGIGEPLVEHVEDAWRL